MEMAIVRLYASMSKWEMGNWEMGLGSSPSSFISPFSFPSPRNFRTLIDARLQALSSRCMYSEQGLEAVIGPVFGHVCQPLIVVSYCMPGSAHSQAACAMSRIRLRALCVCAVSPVCT